MIETAKKGYFTKGKLGEDIYISSNNITYSLLVGKTFNGLTSDIVFIFREPSEEEQNNDFYGCVVDWVYCGWECLEIIESIIINYEKANIK